MRTQFYLTTIALLLHPVCIFCGWVLVVMLCYFYLYFIEYEIFIEY